MSAILQQAGGEAGSVRLMTRVTRGIARAYSSFLFLHRSKIRMMTVAGGRAWLSGPR
jgi:hypothetical protein